MRTTCFLAFTLFLLAACGNDDGATIPGESDSDSVGDDDDVVGDDDDDSVGTCSTWINTYDLTGSKFFIDALIDFEVTLQEPYNGDLNMGPGTMTLRFADSGGAAADGAAFIVDYSLSQDFITGNGLAEVHTVLENIATADCGISTGTLAGTALTFAPETMANHCQNGQISCTGAFCGSAGSPPEDQPEIITDDCGDQPIAGFTFSDDLSSFTMPATILSQDNNATAAMSYVGTLTNSTLDANTPACLCP